MKSASTEVQKSQQISTELQCPSFIKIDFPQPHCHLLNIVTNLIMVSATLLSVQRTLCCSLHGKIEARSDQSWLETVLTSQVEHERKKKSAFVFDLHSQNCQHLKREHTQVVFFFQGSRINSEMLSCLILGCASNRR